MNANELEAVSSPAPAAPLALLENALAPQQAEPASSIESLNSIVAAAVVEHERLTHDAASSVVSLLTAKVRLGMMLADARELLDGRRGFCLWSEQHVNLSLNSIYSLLKLSRFFARDLEALQLRRSLGLATEGLAYLPGEPLHTQVIRSGAKSLTSLYKTIGVLENVPRHRHRRAVEPSPADVSVEANEGELVDDRTALNGDQVEENSRAVAFTAVASGNGAELVDDRGAAVTSGFIAAPTGENAEHGPNGASELVARHSPASPRRSRQDEPPSPPHSVIYQTARELIGRCPAGFTALDPAGLTALEAKMLIFQARPILDFFDRLKRDVDLADGKRLSLSCNQAEGL
jgi:hypothetical protein